MTTQPCKWIWKITCTSHYGVVRELITLRDSDFQEATEKEVNTALEDLTSLGFYTPKEHFRIVSVPADGAMYLI